MTYAAAGACAISVLTEPSRFGGGIDLLAAAAQAGAAPVMRKDFIVDPYQLFEARACGASGVLLIVRMLSDSLLGELADVAAETQMFVLWEAFDATDLARLSLLVERAPKPLLAGLNARDLVTLQVDLERLSRLADQFPVEFSRVAESGLSTSQDAARWAAWQRMARSKPHHHLLGVELLRTSDQRHTLAVITAVHNHLLRASLPVYYMHVGGHGDPVKLAQTLRAALAASGTPLAQPSPAAPAVALDLDTAALDRTLGLKGKVNGGVYQFSVPRREPIAQGGMNLPPSMGTAIALNFQPTGHGKAAITGDFVLLAREVNPVLAALRQHGIDVTALHSHMIDESPHLFFMHFWANDDAVKLAQGLEAALELTDRKRGP